MLFETGLSLGKALRGDETGRKQRELSGGRNEGRRGCKRRVRESGAGKGPPLIELEREEGKLGKRGGRTGAAVAETVAMSASLPSAAAYDAETGAFVLHRVKGR